MQESTNEKHQLELDELIVEDLVHGDEERKDKRALRHAATALPLHAERETEDGVSLGKEDAPEQ